jgi:hypothetical protein
MLVDGNRQNTSKAQEFYENAKDSMFWPPVVLNEWITAENVNELVERNGFGGAIDLLSLDLDGIDYWVWRSLTAASPRVVVPNSTISGVRRFPSLSLTGPTSVPS